MSEVLRTRCPHCKTVFELDAADLDTANGRVRCGECLAVFEARKHSPEQSESAIEPESPAPMDHAAEGESATDNDDVEEISANDNHEFRFDDNTPAAELEAELQAIAGFLDEPGSQEQASESKPSSDTVATREAGDTTQASKGEDWDDLLSELLDEGFEDTASESVDEQEHQDSPPVLSLDFVVENDDGDEPLDFSIAESEEQDAPLDFHLQESDSVGQETSVDLDLTRASGEFEAPLSLELESDTETQADDADESDELDDEQAAEDTDVEVNVPLSADEEIDAALLAELDEVIAAAIPPPAIETEEAQTDGGDAEQDLPADDETDFDDAADGDDESDDEQESVAKPNVVEIAKARMTNEGGPPPTAASDDGQESEAKPNAVEIAKARMTNEGGPPPAANGAATYDADLLDGGISGAAKPRRTLLWVSLCVLTLLAIGAQLVHFSRAKIATIEPYSGYLKTVYDYLDLPLVPAWDVQSMCVEISTSSASSDSLQIQTQIANNAKTSQPLPFIRVSLVDRYNDILGSRLVSATDYLTNENKSVRSLGPGERIRAQFNLAFAGEQAAGYELALCYLDEKGNYRCGGECSR